MHLTRPLLIGCLVVVASAIDDHRPKQQPHYSAHSQYTNSGLTTTRSVGGLSVTIGNPPTHTAPGNKPGTGAHSSTSSSTAATHTATGNKPGTGARSSTSSSTAATHTATSSKPVAHSSTTSSSTAATHTASGGLLNYQNIDTSATSGARALLKYIQSQFGHHTLSGQQDAVNLQWVQKNVGKTPAIQGNDFIDYSPSRIQYGAKSTAVEDAMTFDKEGGINAFVWHWNAPTDLYNTNAEPWYFGFYTKATSFNIQSALAEGTGGSDYKLLLRDIDAIAVEIKRLSDAGIPFLFRPLHEPEGGWFWWGAHGSAPFLQLWGILYDRITNYHGLHNMVWVCNTAVAAWYPGNSKCDIATVDVYPSAGDHEAQTGLWSSLHQVTGGQRVLALAEVGVIPDPASCMSENAPWAYWMTWSGEYISGGSYNSMSFLKGVYTNNDVVTVDSVDKLGQWKDA